MKNNSIRLLDAPESFEVLSSVNGFGELSLLGELCASSEDDGRAFSDECLLVKIINETDGSLALPMTPLSVSGNSFSERIDKIPVGGPYTVDFVMLDREGCVEYSLYGDKVYHLFVGDIYLIAGQSNAAGMGRGAVYDPPELGVSVMRNLEKWDIASTPFSSELRHNMFLSFAKTLRGATGIPIGLIPCAACDSPLSRWLTSEDGDLYDRAILAVGDRRIKGVLWYQGCRDAGDGVSCEDYLRRFSELVLDLRRDLRDENLPVFTFQLNRQRRNDDLPSLGTQYDGIREAQRRIASEVPYVSVLPAIDALNMSDFIHNSATSNIMLGNRLARRVLRDLYGVGYGAYAPEISSAELSGNTLTLTFDNVSEYLSDLNARLSEYPITVRDKEGIIPLSSARLHGNIIDLSLAREAVGAVSVSGQSGIDPRTLIIDYGTGIPMLCFTDFSVSDKRK
jgi:hypothetical protein